MKRSIHVPVLIMIALVVVFLWKGKEQRPERADQDEQPVLAVGRGGQSREPAADVVRPAMRNRSAVRETAEKIRTQSGLVYRVLQKGHGAKPGPADKVRMKFCIYLPSGEDFARSPKDEPMILSVNGLIKGMQEGLQLMQVGAKYRFIIPPELAYGEKGTGGVPANQTLIFDVELVAVEQPAE